jgi:hypothetical protein
MEAPPFHLFVHSPPTGAWRGNLRASARTDLQAVFPTHVCDSWLGHSTRIAERHYLQTTESHWEKAVSSGAGLVSIGGNADGNIGANQDASRVNQGSQKRGIVVGDYAGFPGITEQMPPQGLEPWTR